MRHKIHDRKDEAKYLLKFLLLANFIQFLEAGAVPALLISLSRDFELDHAQLGLLGGVIYIALSVGGPIAGYLLRKYEHKTVIGHAVVANTVLTFLWASTPVQYSFSKALFISLRFVMGLAQCFLCVFLPLWINEYAPGHRRTSWMGYLQASVPLGIMFGYIVASLVTDISRGSETCFYIMCWRWPFFIEVALLVPLCVMLNSLPRAHFDLYMAKRSGPDPPPGHPHTMNLKGRKTASPSYSKLDHTEADRTQDVRTDGSYTPSSSSARGLFETPGALDYGAADDNAYHQAIAPDSIGRYEDLSPFPRRHSMDPLEQARSTKGDSSKKNDSPSTVDTYENPRKERHRLRQHAISASFYSANASRDMMRKSCDDLPNLEMTDDLVTLLSGIAPSRETAAAPTRPELYWDLEAGSGPDSRSLLRLIDTSVNGTTTNGKIHASRGSPKMPTSEDLQSHILAEQGTLSHSSDTWRSIISQRSPVSDGRSLRFLQTPKDGPPVDADGNISVRDEFEVVSARSPLLKATTQSSYGSVVHPATTAATNTAHQFLGAPALQRGSSSGSHASLEGVSVPRRRTSSSAGPLVAAPLRSSREARLSTPVKYESLRDAGKKFAFKSTLSAMRQQMQMYLKGATGPGYQTAAPGTDPQNLAGDLTFSNNVYAASPWRSVPSKNDRGGDDDSRDDESFNSALCDESDVATEEGSISGVVMNKTPTWDHQQSTTDVAIADQTKPSRASVGSANSHDAPSAGSEIGNNTVGRLSASALNRIPPMPRFELLDKTFREGFRPTVASSSDSESVSDDELEGLPSKLHTEENVLVIGAHSPLRPQSVISIICALLNNKVYTYLVLAMAALYFTVTGVQFWGTSYLLLALGAPRPLVNSLFIACAASAPTSGVFFGGWAIDRCGGYKGATQRVVALELCLIFGLLGCSFATPITFVENIYEVVALLWLVLFFGAAVLPACSGIIVSIVPRHSRPVSSSLSLVIFNLFGYFLSLVLSGLLMQAFSHFSLGCEGACPLIWGFRIVLMWSYWALMFLALALLTSYRIVRERQQAKRAAWQRLMEDAERGYASAPFAGHN